MHEGRHSFVSTMIAAGADPGEVMRRAGHSTVAMTVDRYTLPLSGSEKVTADRLQTFIDSARGTVVRQSDRVQGGS